MTSNNNYPFNSKLVNHISNGVGQIMLNFFRLNPFAFIISITCHTIKLS